MSSKILATNNLISDFAPRLLQWFDQHGRHDLPWQKNISPYHVWISEIMLQQTQVATVIDYFQRFINSFPTVKALAKAPEDQVLALWSGLGYYARARNLHKTAKLIITEHQAQFPATLAQLIALPGIGQSTAGAIVSIGFGKRAPILDGNVKRVLTRLHGIHEWPGKTAVNKHLWKLAENYTPQKRFADYTQAMMDLGATLCTRNKPDCHRCPFTSECVAYSTQQQSFIPMKKPQKSLPTKQTYMLIVFTHNQVLLQKRPPIGIWGSLWSFPEFENMKSLSDYCDENFRTEQNAFISCPNFRHTFSHFHLEIHPVILRISTISSHKVMENSEQIWYNLHAHMIKGIPRPVAKLLNDLREYSK